MKVKMRISVGLRYYVPSLADLVEEEEFEVSEGSTLEELLERSGWPEKVATIPFVNGIRVHKSRRLNEGDQIYLVPPTTGG